MVRRKKEIKVAYSQDFLNCTKELSNDQKSKALRFGNKWKLQPTSPEYNYESIEGAPDDKFRSLRISDELRAIVLRSERGDTLVLLWIASHDQAWQWARTHRCEVHPDTGSLQVFEVDIASESAEEEADRVRIGGIFDDYSGKDLRKLGVPSQLMYRVRHVMDPDQFEQIGLKLPMDAYESLNALLKGSSYTSVRDEVAGSTVDEDKHVDQTDIAAALEEDTSRQAFKVADDEDELERVFSGDIENWRVFLHRSQRRLTEQDFNGPVRVLGGAGTGKTVVAMHRAVRLAREVFTGQDDRILFTTFTRNLAADIEENLRRLCDAKTMKRIEVVSLDRWVSSFLKKQGFDKQIKYFGNSRDGTLERLWGEAMQQRPQDQDFPDSFYREEWDQIIQAQGIATKREYFRTDRTGRGSAMQRGQRKAVWPVFEAYRTLMADERVCEREDALRAARQILEQKGDILPYRSVLVDEAQDMSNEAFKLVRQIVPADGRGRANDIFIVGDGHQRIYNHRVILSHCGVHIVGRAYRLRINYRTSEEIRWFAVSVLEGLTIDDLNGGEDTHQGYTSLVRGTPPKVVAHTSLDQEIETIVDFLGESDQHRHTCLVTRTNELLERYRKALDAQGIETYLLSRSKAEDTKRAGVRLATMHRVKGLEFDRVILAGVDEGSVPLAAALEHTQDEATREAAEIQERALFYVASSRAKRDVLITSAHTPSSFIRSSLS